MSPEEKTVDEQILSVLLGIESLVKYQVQLLETVSSNVDEMLKSRKKFDPKKQIDEIQKMMPGNLDLGKIFALVANAKGKSVKDEGK